MFPDEYLQYIINLLEQPQENLNDTIFPKWIINPSLHKDKVPILTGCIYAKYCKDLQCPYLHPKYETSESNIIQVNNIDHNVYTMINDISTHPTYSTQGQYITWNNIITPNINTSINIIAQKKTRGISKSPTQGDSVPRSQTFQEPDRPRTRRERPTTLQGPTRLSTDREGSTSLKGSIRVRTRRDAEDARTHKRFR